MKINGAYINDYKKIIQTTNLQKDYQEFIKFFRYFRTYLEKELNEYTFTSNIVENNMDYSYFQFTNESLKKKGLKIVITFVHKDFNYEIWLSGINRKVQRDYYNNFKNRSNEYIFTSDPNRTDYILKAIIKNDFDYSSLDELLISMKNNIITFINNIGS